MSIHARLGRVRNRTALVAVVLAGLLAAGSPVGAAGHVEEIASGFVTPLGLAIGDDGTIYVAEAFAGQLTSLKADDPDDRTVLHAVAGSIAGIDAKGKGNVAFTSAGEDATLSRITPNGKTTTLASLADYEATFNPDAGQQYGFLPGSISEECRALLPDLPEDPVDFLRVPYTGIIDSNPYAVAIDGGSYLVADAGGNTIVRVGANGRLSTVAVLPPVPQTITQDVIDSFIDPESEFSLELPACTLGATYTGEFVPTDIEVGPDGHYYVTSLPGFPEGAGEASVWRIHRRTGELTKVADGFFGAVDLAVAGDGTIYVAELFGNRISAISPSGEVSTVAEVPMPGAIEVARDGTVYATIGVFFGGSLVRINP
jgi:sugar lactone lactonase YvrE